MDSKTAETTHNINKAFGPANECTVQWWFKKFCKGDESLEYEHSGWPSEVDNDQLRAISEADPLTTTREVAEELSGDYSTVIQHLKQLGKVKKPSNWVPHELNTNPRTVALKSYSTQQRTISRSDRDMWRQVNFI